MAREKLFFIALLPPQGIAAEITSFKIEMDVLYQSKAALKVMPHITLKAPFKVPAEKQDDVLKWFSRISTAVEPFTVKLENFGAFPNRHNPVIFVHPQMSESLAQLQADIIKGFGAAFPLQRMSTYEHTFNPHVTIAYRDLTWERFEAAWAVYRHKTYHASFTAHTICLLQHDGTRWNVVRELTIGN